MNLRILSFNCESFSKNVEFVKMLLVECDVLLLQETLLTENSIELLNDVDPDFSCFATPAVRREDVFVGKSSGGLAVYYRKSLTRYVKPIYYSQRIMGLNIVCNSLSYLLLNVYCVCDYRDDNSMISYQTTMAEISDLSMDEKYSKVILAGDFNCDPNKGRFFNEFFIAMNGLSLSIVDIDRLPQDSHTYVARNSTCSTSWLDHVAASDPNIISNVFIKYGFTLEDHIPIGFDIRVNFDVILENTNDIGNLPSTRHIAWNKVGLEDARAYECKLSEGIHGYFNEALSCSEDSCKDVHHFRLLDEAYSFSISCMQRASEVLPCSRSNGAKYRHVAGWNDHCKELHDVARSKYLVWNYCGRPRDNSLFIEMKEARNNFKSALDHCRRNEMYIKRSKLVDSFKDRSKTNFWKEVKRSSGIRIQKSNCIDGSSSVVDIVRIFEEKYKAIFDDESCQIDPEGYGDSVLKLRMAKVNNLCSVFPHVVDESIDKLKEGIGWDGIHKNHLKHCGKSFVDFLSRIFSSFIRHAHMPVDILRGEFRPIVKNAKGDINDSNNYRPVMISSNLLKVFEYCLLPVFKMYIKPNKWQFGYVSDASCLSPGLILKEVIHKYNSSKSDVHCAMLDFSKAFDRINIKLLIKKLIDSNLPVPIVKILGFMFENVYAHVMFANHKGNSWKIGNGTRQGGILSPYLFNFYMSHIVEYISSLDVGCRLDYESTNILVYADDVTLLAPSQEGIRFLISKFCECLRHMSLNFNDKSSYIVFSRNKCRRNYSVIINNKILSNESHCKYLGYILSSNSNIECDVNRCSQAFLRQFNSMYRRFNFLNIAVLSFLFTAFCSSFYACELWYNEITINSRFNKISIMYHKAIKRISGLTPWDSNHEASEIAGIPLFKHFLALKILKFLFSTQIKTTGCLIANLKLYIKYSSNISKSVSVLFDKIYNVNNIFNNDLSALISRIFYVQRNEPRSFYHVRNVMS